MGGLRALGEGACVSGAMDVGGGGGVPCEQNGRQV